MAREPRRNDETYRTWTPSYIEEYKTEMKCLLANIIFMFFHGLYISCFYASDYVTLLNMTWTRD